MPQSEIKEQGIAVQIVDKVATLENRLNDARLINDLSFQGIAPSLARWESAVDGFSLDTVQGIAAFRPKPNDYIDSLRGPLLDGVSRVAKSRFGKYLTDSSSVSKHIGRAIVAALELDTLGEFQEGHVHITSDVIDTMLGIRSSKNDKDVDVSKSLPASIWKWKCVMHAIDEKAIKDGADGQVYIGHRYIEADDIKKAITAGIINRLGRLERVSKLAGHPKNYIDMWYKSLGNEDQPAFSAGIQEYLQMMHKWIGRRDSHKTVAGDLLHVTKTFLDIAHTVRMQEGQTKAFNIVWESANWVLWSDETNRIKTADVAEVLLDGYMGLQITPENESVAIWKEPFIAHATQMVEAMQTKKATYTYSERSTLLMFSQLLRPETSNVEHKLLNDILHVLNDPENLRTNQLSARVLVDTNIRLEEAGAPDEIRQPYAELLHNTLFGVSGNIETQIAWDEVMQRMPVKNQLEWMLEALKPEHPAAYASMAYPVFFQSSQFVMQKIEETQGILRLVDKVRLALDERKDEFQELHPYIQQFETVLQKLQITSL